MAKQERVIAVFDAACQAACGKGNVVAVVQGKENTGEHRLYGVTSLVRIGVLPVQYDGRRLTAVVLAKLLGVKVVVGVDACRKFIVDSGIATIPVENILGNSNDLMHKGGKRKLDF